MNNFIKSFLPLLKRLKLKKYLLEIFLLTISVIITVTALTIYIKNSRENIDQTVISNGQSEKVLSEKIFVDVSGAVKKPNIYQVDFGARIKDVIDKAGGLSDDADVLFFNRNYNLARIVNDQEKIYIPSIMEIDNGIFTQNQRTLDYVLPSEASAKEDYQQIEIQSLINLNSAAAEELDQLPGVGQVTANKIIDNRPYSTLEELLIKKIVNKGVFEKIKSLITL